MMPAESTFRRHLEAVLLMILSAGLLVQMEQRWSRFAGQMAVWLRWILGLITPPISPRLPA
jgi:hypothetical protein